jgi:hypothetical protein
MSQYISTVLYMSRRASHTEYPQSSGIAFYALHKNPRIPGYLSEKSESGRQLCAALVGVPQPTTSYCYVILITI